MCIFSCECPFNEDTSLRHFVDVIEYVSGPNTTAIKAPAQRAMQLNYCSSSTEVIQFSAVHMIACRPV